MNNIIVIDTDSLDQISSCFLEASDKMDNCMSNLSKVMEHNDWGCKEKKNINECISKLKNSSHKMHEDYSRISLEVKRITNQYRELIDRDDLRVSQVDQQVGSMLSLLVQINGKSATRMPPPKIVPIGTVKRITIVRNIIESSISRQRIIISNPYKRIVWNNTVSNISVVRMKDILSGMEK